MKEVGKIYSAVDADELEAGDIVAVADHVSELKDTCIFTLHNIMGNGYQYRFIVVSDLSYCLAKLVCPKKHAKAFWAWKNGAKVRVKDNFTGEFVETIPTWNEEDEYIIVEEKDPIKPEPKKRLMTNRELAKWCAQGNGQWSYDTVCTYATYDYCDDDNELVGSNIRIRAWNEEEWHEPLVEVEE